MGDNSSHVVEGREAWADALRQALLGAAALDARVLWCVDVDFDDWPLGEPAVVDALVQWARPPGRVLRLVGGDFGQLALRHPRLAQWRRDWSHRFEAFTPADAAEAAALPGLLLAGARGLELLDRVRCRARVLDTAAELRQLEERCEVLLERCTPAWAATTLGL